MPDQPPRTAEDYLKEGVGSLVAQLLFQLAVLRAENDQLRAARADQNTFHPKET